jgi:hypothetical protein
MAPAFVFGVLPCEQSRQRGKEAKKVPNLIDDNKVEDNQRVDQRCPYARDERSSEKCGAGRLVGFGLDRRRS